MPKLKVRKEVEINKRFKNKVKAICIEKNIPLKEAIEVPGKTYTNFYAKVRNGSLSLAEAVKILDYIGATDAQKLEILKID